MISEHGPVKSGYGPVQSGYSFSTPAQAAMTDIFDRLVEEWNKHYADPTADDVRMEQEVVNSFVKECREWLNTQAPLTTGQTLHGVVVVLANGDQIPLIRGAQERSMENTPSFGFMQ